MALGKLCGSFFCIFKNLVLYQSFMRDTLQKQNKTCTLLHLSLKLLKFKFYAKIMILVVLDAKTPRCVWARNTDQGNRTPIPIHLDQGNGKCQSDRSQVIGGKLLIADRAVGSLAQAGFYEELR